VCRNRSGQSAKPTHQAVNASRSEEGEKGVRLAGRGAAVKEVKEVEEVKEVKEVGEEGSRARTKDKGKGTKCFGENVTWQTI
jgi:hypothetical protein